MALIKRSDADRVAKNALVLDLADVARKGAMMERRARDAAAAAIADAEAERIRLTSNAAAEGREAGYTDGFNAGREAGLESGREEAIAETNQRLSRLGETLAAAFASFEHEREQMILDARRDIITLASIVCERVTKRVATIDRSIAEAQVEAALRAMTRASVATVSVCPKDAGLVREAMPEIVRALDGLDHCELSEDASLSAGSCVVRSAGGGVVDATVEGQLERLLREALPDADRTLGSPVTPDVRIEPDAARGAEGLAETSDEASDEFGEYESDDESDST